MRQQTRPNPKAIKVQNGLVYINFDDGHCATFVPYAPGKKLQYRLRNFQLKYEGILVAQFNVWIDEKLRTDDFITLREGYRREQVLAYWEQALRFAEAEADADMFSGPLEYACLVAKTSKRSLKAAKKRV